MCNTVKMGRLHTMGILVILVNFSTIITVVSTLTLTGPTEYTAFTGDINIVYKNLTVEQPKFQLVELPSENILETVPLSNQFPEGEFQIGCGSIDYAGKFAFRIINDVNQEVVKQVPCTVRWPDFTLTIPPNIETSSANVNLKFEVKNEIKCNSKHAETKYHFNLLWYKDSDDKTQVEVAEEFEVSQFQNLDTNPVVMNCQLFDQPGIYQIVFKSSKDKVNPLAKSNEMVVTWSRDYAISTEATEIFPCDGAIKVYYTQPRCPGKEDKINLSKQIIVANSPAAEKKLEYKTQRRAEDGRTDVSFSCDTFEDTAFGYCFSYVSYARNQAAHEQDSFCIPTTFVKAAAIDGGWSEWTQWTSCPQDAQSCEAGAQQKSTRYRKCDNPAPNANGKFCVGDTVEEKSCGVKCAAPTTLHPPKVFTPDPKCLCGCQIATDRGTIVSSDKCEGSSLWIITVKKDYVIKLTFEQYKLNPANSHTKLYVRDGDTTRSELIIQDNGEHPPRVVESSQNKMWIEYDTPYDSDNIISTGEGFAATFVATKNNQSGAGLNEGNSGTIWSSTLLVGAVLLVVAVLAVVLFYLYHRHNVKKRTKLQQQMHNQALLVNGEAHTSPSHSASVSSIKGSTNVTFGETSGGSPSRKSGHKKRDYIVPKDHPHSPTRVRNVKSKHHRKRSHSPSKRKSSNEIKDSPSHNLPAPANYSSPHSKHRQAHNAGNTPTSVYSISSHGYMPVSTLGSPGHTPPVGTPGSTGSPVPPHRGEPRNKSFISAVKKTPPMAGEEDLSPTSPVGGHPGYPVTAHPVNNTGQYGQQEQIPLDAYYNVNNDDKYGRVAETGMYSPHTQHKYSHSPYNVPEKRPPVEGRDSLTRNQKAVDPTYENASHRLATPDRQNANYIMPTYQSTKKPEIKPLPLRSVQRPDGQSPDTNTSEDKTTVTPHSYVSSELSPMFQNAKMFPETLSKGPSEMDLDMPGMNDFEYDDYVPDLPGSYFSMDPHAYTLTWSQQPTWTGTNKNKAQQQFTGSQPSLGPDNNGSMC